MLTQAGLAAVFEPRRIALVGASDRPGSVGRLLWDNLVDFPGEVLPVSQAATVGGRPAYPDLRHVPGHVDLAVIVTPAATVPDIIRSADQKVSAVVVLSAGFAETGPDGAKLQAEAVAAARAGGVRLVGPNCFGVQNADLPLNASIAAGTPRGGGGVSIVTQSGSYGMAVHALGQDEGLRVAKVFAAGNKADITDAEVLAYLRQDQETRVICLLLESITDARRFFTEACRTTPVKPVIAVVGGRTGAGQRAAVSHTAALAADEAVRDAALRQAGVVRVRTGLQVLDAARALSGQPMPRGRRVAVVTNSGGTGVELADLLADEGLQVPELSPALQEELRVLLPGYASAVNPVDMTPAWSLFATVYPAAIELLARSGEIDVVVPVLLQRSASPEVAAAVRDAVARLRADGITVPVYVCWVAPRSADAHTGVLQEAGIPCFAWPQRAAQAAGAAVRCGVRVGEPLRPAPRPSGRRASRRHSPAGHWRPAAAGFTACHPHFLQRGRQICESTIALPYVWGVEHFHQRVTIRRSASNFDFTDGPVKTNHGKQPNSGRFVRPARRTCRSHYYPALHRRGLEHPQITHFQSGEFNCPADGSFHIFRRFFPSTCQGVTLLANFYAPAISVTCRAR